MIGSTRGYIMRSSVYVALAALLAAPAGGSTERGESALPMVPPVDWLYPELPVDDESWRGLLPIILLDTETLADNPIPANVRSERRQEQDARPGHGR